MSKRHRDDLTDILRALEAPALDALPGTTLRNDTEEDAPQDILLDVAASAPDAAPPDDLFARIESEIDAPPIEGVETIPASDSGWHDRGQGVWVKLMSKAPDGKCVYLLRCMPGGVVPAHTHTNWEYALVLEGRFQIAGRTVRAGDAQHSAANSFHPEITTDTGCLILVVA